MVGIILSGWKPAVLVLFLVAGCIWGVWLVEQSTVFVDENSRPLDWAGESVPCPYCGHAVPDFIHGYRYRCPKCGTRYKARQPEGGLTREYSDVVVPRQ